MNRPTFITSGPFDFTVALPAPPLPHPQLVIFPVGSGATVRLIMTWAEIEQLRDQLTESLHYRAEPFAGTPEPPALDHPEEPRPPSVNPQAWGLRE